MNPLSMPRNRFPVLTRIAGRDRPRERASRDLVDEFVLLTSDLSPDVAGEILGVSAATIRRWRRSGARKLDGPVRDRLLRYVAEEGRPPEDPGDAGGETRLRGAE